MQWYWIATVAIIAIVILGRIFFRSWINRRFEREFVETLKSARSLDLETKKQIARYVLDKTSVIERAREIDGPAGISIAKMLSEEATKDRHAALAAGATSDVDPDWNAAALVESWATSLVGSLNGKMSPHVHEAINSMLGEYVAEVMRQQGLGTSSQ